MKKRSISIDGHRTSISLEDDFWDALQEIAQARGLSIQALIAHIEQERTAGGTDLPSENLSGAVRVMILRYYRQDST